MKVVRVGSYLVKVRTIGVLTDVRCEKRGMKDDVKIFRLRVQNVRVVIN